MAQGKFTTSPTPSNIVSAVNAMVDDIAGKAASSHNHSASNITSGTLAVARGGTGVTANPSMLTILGSTSAASVFAASPRPGVTGTLPVANGGTGQTTASGIRNALGLGNTTGAVPIANGGTGATTVADARNNLGLGNTSGALPIANGGTGATSAASARSNLGVSTVFTDASVSGNTITITKADGNKLTLPVNDLEDTKLENAVLLFDNITNYAWGVTDITLTQPYTDFKKLVIFGITYGGYLGCNVISVKHLQKEIEISLNGVDITHIILFTSATTYFTLNKKTSTATNLIIGINYATPIAIYGLK